MEKTRILHVDNTTKNPEADYVYPRIRLQGKWLEKAGFNPGDKVAVYVTQNKISLIRGDRS